MLLGTMLPRGSLDFCACSVVRASRDILYGVFKWVGNVPGIKGEVYIHFIREIAFYLFVEVDKKRSWRWEGGPMPGCNNHAPEQIVCAQANSIG